MSYRHYPEAEAYTTQVYYVQCDIFQRPIEFKLFTNYHNPDKLQVAFEAAYYPAKLRCTVEPFEGMQFMRGTEVFDELGNTVRD